MVLYTPPLSTRSPFRRGSGPVPGGIAYGTRKFDAVYASERTKSQSRTRLKRNRSRRLSMPRARSRPYFSLLAVGRGGRSDRGLEPPEHERVRHDGHGAEAHRGAREHGMQEEAEAEREQDAGGDGDERGVVEERPEQVLTDLGDRAPAELDRRDDVAHVVLHEDDARRLHRPPRGRSPPPPSPRPPPSRSRCPRPPARARGHR